jgi:macrolide transport system ATP-binding/permease protein
MTPLWRQFLWWLQGRRKEDEVREELAFHLAREIEERRAAGLSDDEARWAAQRDLGNEARLREDARAIWTWRPLDELSQDLRFACRTLFKTRAVAVFAIISLALGIGANTAIYSFMDAILVRSLPIADPGSLVVLAWRSKPFSMRENTFVMRAMDGEAYGQSGGIESRIFPFTAYERLQGVSAPVLSSLFAHKQERRINVLIRGQAEVSDAEYVTGNFFGGLGVSPAAGRLIVMDDDRPGAPPVAVVSHGYGQRRFGAAVNAVGEQILVDNLPFTIVGVAPPEFFGVDPAAAPALYLPLRSESLLNPDDARKYQNANYYWLEMMGRLQPGVSIAQAQSALAAPFAAWVGATAENDAQRANLPALHVAEGAGGLNTLRRRYSRPLYVLLAMVGLILAIACANTANLLLARATVRRREIAVRLSLGAGRFRLIRQLLTESLVLASMSGAVGILIAIAGTRLLTLLLANGDTAFTLLQVDLNWRVLAITMLLSMLCGVMFGLAPAIQSTRPALVTALKDSGDGQLGRRGGRWRPRLSLQKALVVGQISVLMLLLIAAGLFVQTVTNLHGVVLGFNQENVLLFELNAPQAGRPPATVPAFYDDLRKRFADIPGVREVTLSHSSLLRAGRGHPVRVDGAATDGTRFMQTGPGFFSTMQIPMLQGREIDERDDAGSAPVAVISNDFARRFMPNQNPIGRTISVYGGPTQARQYEVIGIAATAKYGPIKGTIPPVIYVPYGQLPPGYLQQMTYALRTDGDPLRHVDTIRKIVNNADSRVPVTNVITQEADINRMINQEIVMARLGTTFAILALVIACVGLYGTMSYGVACRTREIGIRVALGARRGLVVWMVMRDVIVLTAIGLAISIPLARGTSQFVSSFLFDLKPNDPRAIAIALVTLVSAALVAGYGPARRASRIDPTTALRDQ